jgi:hypothetical protein
MLDRLLDTESISWRDPSFFSEEALLQQALPYLDLLVNDLWAARNTPASMRVFRSLSTVRSLRSMDGWTMQHWQDGFNALNVLHKYWERNAADGAFDSNPDMWTSWLFAFTFFEIVEAKRVDVQRAYRENLKFLSN